MGSTTLAPGNGFGLAVAAGGLRGGRRGALGNGPVLPGRARFDGTGAVRIRGRIVVRVGVEQRVAGGVRFLCPEKSGGAPAARPQRGAAPMPSAAAPTLAPAPPAASAAPVPPAGSPGSADLAESPGGMGSGAPAGLSGGAAPFVRRHVGPSPTQQAGMLHELGLASREELIAETIPAAIRRERGLRLPPALPEADLLRELRRLAGRNRVRRSFIGRGYYGTVTPPVILRNLLENPGWYTQYTPYQSEISQGRLELLLNFQTLTADLTGLPVAGASLLDEATAAAEAMSMCHAAARGRRPVFLADRGLHRQTLAVLRTRAEAAGIRLRVQGLEDDTEFSGEVSGVLAQYPDTRGRIRDFRALAARVREAGGLFVAATDLLALTLLTPPGEFGADLAVGSTQRFGMPMGGGGPHAAFLATGKHHARRLPGRVVGISRDTEGRRGFRLALQTREQHIRRDRATSNICTAQVLPALVAVAYAVWHGPEGLVRIARRVRQWTLALGEGLRRLGLEPGPAEGPVFDTLTVVVGEARAERVLEAAAARGIALGRPAPGEVGVSLDETAGWSEVEAVLGAFVAGVGGTGTNGTGTNGTGSGKGVVEAAAGKGAMAAGESGSPDRAPEPGAPGSAARLLEAVAGAEELPAPFRRTSVFLEQEVFHRNRSEHEMLRWLHRLQARDLSLTTSMIPLGSCTMKLNAAAEMIPVTWPDFADLHPFAPAEDAAGYARLYADLEEYLAEITGFAAVSLQPNAGSQGEFAGLLMIRAFHRSRGESERDLCFIPKSAHGTNPASAALAGYRVVPVGTAPAGDIDLEDLRARLGEHPGRAGALMITYPSTHGVFEEGVREVCRLAHEAGALVYLDGANLNAQVGLTSPAAIGADVCHLNLHKTFCIPHGGGGPGMGPVACTAALAPFLPGHPEGPPEWAGEGRRVGAVSAAPYGSPAILPISWAYIRLMGPDGLREASEVAILSANLMAHRLREHYPLLYAGRNGRVAHEFILDCRPFAASSGVGVEDIAKRLMDYGFHAPTMSFPVPGTLMIEPTESESGEELDRFCEALISIRAEIREIEEGRMDREDNPLKRAPHTAREVTADAWERPYSRSVAAFPAPWTLEHKYWPPVSRIDNAAGDRNLVCTCPSHWEDDLPGERRAKNGGAP